MLAAPRTVLFVVLCFLLTVVYGCTSLLLGGFSQVTRHRIIISWCSLVIALARWICGIRYQVQGREHLKNLEGPVVVMSKHQSTWETLYLQILFFPASTILKKSLLDLPFFGWGLRGLRPIAIDRSNPRDALRQVRIGGEQGIKDNLNILIFPEGTRMLPGERGKYARSGADIAIASNVKVIPIAMNAGECWLGDNKLRLPGLVTVHIGAPIESANKTSRELTEEVEAWIESAMQQLPPAR
ncbi:MAG: lysophospholipid acyltransferase family protein [Marinagarivorans sp.]|nr:lysophospholipid acyltransferase family protein [Marinagarivorans sp.]